ncbi:BZ3500_MvSof-1268-A1-R1_Chr2-1g04151 [Microbotryum saponariae]|uniref:BZ3500_MvSof-1268-A1-R1_Chr2-1g04151 protein n=1 Tax=Microbotryum saponariae TaxID=289078 RepID=A0A2X0KHN8_9BASI|nr:BZ3500_MvSof-1268-A1-R1_Chr2-1g04151 [Microbotryum saponariae]SCZ91138.1 BZ3501_MvSof-1269-A2-R1_Chr2-1g03807 [Microbotryum saponariae]
MSARKSCNFIKVSERSQWPVMIPTQETLISILSLLTLKVHSIALDGLAATDIHGHSLFATNQNAECKARAASHAHGQGLNLAELTEYRTNISRFPPFV